MASNTTLYTGDTGMPTLEASAASGDSPVKPVEGIKRSDSEKITTEKPKASTNMNFFKKK